MTGYLRKDGLLGAAALGSTVLARIGAPAIDFDLWHQMALAREVLAAGRVPVTDQFSYTPALPIVVHHEWGAGVVAYALAASLGPSALMLLKYVLAGAVAWLTARSALRRGGTVAGWAWLALPAIWLFATGVTALRAQAYTYVFTAALLWCLQSDEDGNRRWLIPWLVVFPVWANLHGGCVLGLVLVGATWAERVLQRKPHRHLLAALAAMFALLIVNPYGLAYYNYLWRALAMARPRISEWVPIWRDPTPTWIPFAICASVALYALLDALFRRRELPSGSGIVLLTMYAGATHVKLLPIFAIALVAIVPGWLTKTPAGHRLDVAFRRNRDLVAAAWLIVLIVMTAVLLTRPGAWWRLSLAPDASAQSTEASYPVGAVRYLEARSFHGNVMTPFEYGGYVTYKLYPAVRVGMDGRYEVAYSEEVFQTVADFYEKGQNAHQVLEVYPTDLVLISRRDTAALNAMPPAWRRVYIDPDYTIWARPGLDLQVVESPVNWTPADDRDVFGTLPAYRNGRP